MDAPDRIIGVPRSLMSMRPTLFFFLCWFACTVMAQQISVPKPRSGSIIGTATDVQDEVVPGATVVLDGGVASGQQKATTNQNGFFSFNAVQPGVSYHVTIHANGFVDWTSPAIQITPGQYMDMGSIRLTIFVAATTVVAALPPEQIATEQVRVAEKQRALGFIPAFYAVYDPHPVPLTPKLKFTLAYRTAIDPVIMLGTAFIAGIDQASDTPDYVQGVKGYGQRFGANYANDLTTSLSAGRFCPRFCIRTRGTITRARAARDHARGMRSGTRLSARGTTASGSRTIRVLAGTWLRARLPIPTIRQAIADLGWYSARPESISAPTWPMPSFRSSSFTEAKSDSVLMRGRSR